MAKNQSTPRGKCRGIIEMSLSDKEFIESIEDTLKDGGWTIKCIINGEKTCAIDVCRDLDERNDEMESKLNSGREWNSLDFNELRQMYQEVRSLKSEVDTLRAEVNTLRQMVEWREPHKIGPGTNIWPKGGSATDPYISEPQPFANPCKDSSGYNPWPWNSITCTTSSDRKYDVKYE